MKKCFPVILTLIVFSSSCAVQSQKFDSEKWKAGGKSVRGGMIEDLRNNKILDEKTRAQVEELLGKPDEGGENFLGYEVKTISRCHFWKCLLEINFDSQTQRMRGNIAISD